MVRSPTFSAEASAFSFFFAAVMLFAVCLLVWFAKNLLSRFM